MTNEDVKYLNQIDYESATDAYIFYLIVKNDSIIRLIRLELMHEFILKSLAKLKQQDSGTFSQLLPATLKISIHAVFTVEPNVKHMRTANIEQNKYIVTFQSDNDLSLLIKTFNIEHKKMASVNMVTLDVPIHKVDLSLEFPYYITVVDVKKRVVLS